MKGLRSRVELQVVNEYDFVAKTYFLCNVYCLCKIPQFFMRNTMASLSIFRRKNGSTLRHCRFEMPLQWPLVFRLLIFIQRRNWQNTD